MKIGTMLGGVFKRVRRFLRWLNGPRPLDSIVLDGKLRPAVFRRLEDRDIPRCLEIYRLNEPDRFPAGGTGEYEDCLRKGEPYFLVLEEDSQVIAVCGMCFWCRPDACVFSYGLVDPAHQGKGVGTMMLLARIAMIEADHKFIQILIFAVVDSIGFYQRFGFLYVDPWSDETGKVHPSGRLSITADEIDRCRTLLDKHGIEIPRDRKNIPFVELPEAPGVGAGGF